MVCTIDNKSVIKNALNVLGKKNLALIMHSGSAPAIEGENTGFGSINSNGGKEVIDWAKGVFNAIQLGPAGKTKSCDSSPYTGTIFSGNPLFIDLKQLTTSEWNNILSVEKYNEIVKKAPSKLYDLYVSLYIKSHTQSTLADSLGYTGNYIYQLNRRLLVFIYNEINKGENENESNA